MEGDKEDMFESSKELFLRILKNVNLNIVNILISSHIANPKKKKKIIKITQLEHNLHEKS